MKTLFYTAFGICAILLFTITISYIFSPIAHYLPWIKITDLSIPLYRRLFYEGAYLMIQTFCVAGVSFIVGYLGWTIGQLLKEEIEERTSV